MVQDNSCVVQVGPPGEEVTVYPMMASPPSELGADHETVAEPTPETADTESGAAGLS
jgi:hypothetical protein